MSFELNRLRSGERIVAAGSIALFVFMFFFKWFGIKVPGIVGAYISAAGVSTSATAWHSLEVIRWLLLLTVLAGVALVVLVGGDRKLQSPISMSAIVAGLGALSTILVFYRVLLSHPFSHAEVKIGAWLGLVSCAVIAYGGYRAMTDEGTTLSDVREQARASFDSVTTPPGSSESSTEGETPSYSETPTAPPAAPQP
jgi:hypothetical protein